MKIGKPRMLLVAPLGLLALIAIVGWWSRGQANAGGPKEIASPAQANIQDIKEQSAALNSKATLASSGDEAAVRSLADAVFEQFGSPEINDALSGLKERVVIADISYRREGKGGVSEGKLVNSLNQFTKELGAPEFARVSVPQLRYLRTNLLTAYPSFISQLSDRESGSLAFSSEMSPLQATGLAMLLVTQKLSNEDFQVSPEAWAANQYQKEVARWEAHRKGAPNPDRLNRGPKVRRVPENARGKELENAFRNHATDMAPLIDRLSTRLGLSTEGMEKR